MNKEQLLRLMDSYMANMKETCAKKNADYTNANADVFFNFTRVEDLGVATTEQGILTRMVDKFSRLATIVSKKELQVKDETVFDTLQDLGNYGFLLYAYLWQKSEKEKKPVEKAAL